MVELDLSKIPEGMTMQEYVRSGRAKADEESLKEEKE